MIQCLKIITALLLCSFNLEAHEVEKFHWTKEKTDFAKIQVDVAGPGTIENFVQVSRRVSIHPDHLAYVIPKVQGTAYVRKNLVDLVEKGDILALVESKEVSQARASYVAALKKWNYTQALLHKEMQLQGISAGQDLLNAEWAAAEAEIDMEMAAQNLFILGLSQEEINRIPQERQENQRYFAIKSPISGEILHRNLTLGEVFDTSKPVFTVGNFDKVWVEIHVSNQMFLT